VSGLLQEGTSQNLGAGGHYYAVISSTSSYDDSISTPPLARVHTYRLSLAVRASGNPDAVVLLDAGAPAPPPVELLPPAESLPEPRPFFYALTQLNASASPGFGLSVRRTLQSGQYHNYQLRMPVLAKVTVRLRPAPGAPALALYVGTTPPAGEALQLRETNYAAESWRTDGGYAAWKTLEVVRPVYGDRSAGTPQLAPGDSLYITVLSRGLGAAVSLAYVLNVSFGAHEAHSVPDSVSSGLELAASVPLLLPHTDANPGSFHIVRFIAPVGGDVLISVDHAELACPTGWVTSAGGGYSIYYCWWGGCPQISGWRAVPSTCSPGSLQLTGNSPLDGSMPTCEQQARDLAFRLFWDNDLRAYCTPDNVQAVLYTEWPDEGSLGHAAVAGTPRSWAAYALSQAPRLSVPLDSLSNLGAGGVYYLLLRTWQPGTLRVTARIAGFDAPVLDAAPPPWPGASRTPTATATRSSTPTATDFALGVAAACVADFTVVAGADVVGLPLGVSIAGSAASGCPAVCCATPGCEAFVASRDPVAAMRGDPVACYLYGNVTGLVASSFGDAGVSGSVAPS
jgi:hypothetical protein